MMLAKVILDKSQKYKVSSKILTAILMQESRYDLYAVNHKSKDFGIAQINYKNIKNMNLDKNKLMTNMDYSIEAGAKILSGFKRYEHKEPQLWWSRYNCGNKKINNHKCIRYADNVNRWM